MRFLRSIARSVRALARPDASFERLLQRERRCLYAGDVPDDRRYDHCVGLSLTRSDPRHIRHDVAARLPLPDACIDTYQSEDVFEHIEPRLLPAVLDEIHRVLRPGGLFRLSVPDYRCDLLLGRTRRDERGELLFDPGVGGALRDGKVVDGGHVWFPRFESVKALLEGSRFTDLTFLHHYDADGRPVTRPIDYSLGHVARTPDHDERVRDPYRPLSIVVDCRK